MILRDITLALPDTDYTVAFCFKTTAKDVRLCEASCHYSYNNRWSAHVVSLNQGKARFQLPRDQALETPGLLNDDQWHQVVTTVGPGGGDAMVAIDELKIFGHALAETEVIRLSD